MIFFASVLIFLARRSLCLPVLYHIAVLAAVLKVTRHEKAANLGLYMAHMVII